MTNTPAMGQLEVGRTQISEITLVNNSNDYRWQQAQELERAVFIASGFYDGHDDYAQDYDPLTPDSSFVVAQIGGELVGAARVTHPGVQPFLTFSAINHGDLQLHERGQVMLAGLLPEDTIVECNIAVDATHRSHFADRGAVLHQLVSGVLRHVLELAEEANEPGSRAYIVAAFHRPAYLLFKRLYGPQAVQAVGPPVQYKGSSTVPTLLDADGMVRYDASKGQKALLTLLGGLAVYEF